MKVKQSLKDNALIILAFIVLIFNKSSLLFFSDVAQAKAFYYATSQLHAVILVFCVLNGKAYKRILWAYAFLQTWILGINIFHSGIFSFLEIFIFLAFTLFTAYEIEKNDNKSTRIP